MREMGQSAWLSTSSLTLQGWKARVNAMETGTGCNDRISWSNNYSVWPASNRGFGEAPRGKHAVMQDAQKDRSARPQRVKVRGVPFRVR